MGHNREVALPDIFGGRREDLCPHGQTETEHLRISERSRVEPQVEMRRTVSPSAHVNPADLANGLDGTIDSHDELSQFCGVSLVQAVEVNVFARFEEQLNWNRRASFWRKDAPPVIDPDATFIRLKARLARSAARFP